MAGALFGDVGGSLFVGGAPFGDVGPSVFDVGMLLFVAGAPFGGCCRVTFRGRCSIW